MEKIIAKSYARLIRAGRRTMADVPDELRALIAEMLGE